MEEMMQPSDLWSVHSETDGRPMMRAWAKTEAEANELLQELKRSDEDSEKTQYWVLQLTKGDVLDFKASGFIPADA